MNIIPRLKHFREIHEEAEKEIHELVFSEYSHPKDIEFQKLASWMLHTKIDFYDYLPEKYASFCGSAEGFRTLLNLIHYSIVDDGYIAFYQKGQYRVEMILDDPETDDMEEIRKHIMNQQEMSLYKSFKRHFPEQENRCDIKKLDIKPSEFGKLVEEMNEKFNELLKERMRKI